VRFHRNCRAISVLFQCYFSIISVLLHCYFIAISSLFHHFQNKIQRWKLNEIKTMVRVYLMKLRWNLNRRPRNLFKKRWNLFNFVRVSVLVLLPNLFSFHRWVIQDIVRDSSDDHQNKVGCRVWYSTLYTPTHTPTFE
jgi:hypothetical protein